MHAEMTPVTRLSPAEYNPRTISKEDMDSLKRSIERFGFVENIVANKDGTIISGHQRYKAAKDLGHAEVPVYFVDLDKDSEKALNVAMNRISGEFDMALLPGIIDSLPKEMQELTGFSEEEISNMLGTKLPAEVEEDEAPPVPSEARTKLGDLYILGNHRLLCGDATSVDDVEKLTGGERMDMVYTDPPYGISIVNTKGKVSTGLLPGPGLTGKVGGDKPFGKVFDDSSMKSKQLIKSNVYASIIGDDTTQTAIDSYNLCAALKIPVMIFWGGNYYAEALPPSSCWIVWDKDNGESFFADAELAWTNQKTAVRIFKHTWNGLIKESERTEKRVHPTQKPAALAVWCYENYGEEGDNVLDLFGGSGSSLIACEQVNRNCYMMEMSPNYCDVIVHRWEKLTGQTASLQQHG